MDPVGHRSDEEYSAGGDGQVYRWMGTMGDWVTDPTVNQELQTAEYPNELKNIKNIEKGRK